MHTLSHHRSSFAVLFGIILPAIILAVMLSLLSGG